MTKPARFTQSDLTRALKAAVEANVRVKVAIEPNGRMEVTMIDTAANDDGVNPLDRVFKQ